MADPVLSYLAHNIAELELEQGAARRFVETVRALSPAATASPVVRQLDALCRPNTEPAALEALLPHAELVLLACIHEATADGDYPQDKAREVGRLAHALGLSAAGLAELEAEVFEARQVFVGTE